MFSENHIYTFYYIYKKGFHYRLPTIMKKKIYTFFLFFGTVQTLYNKNISLYKRFFLFLFYFFFSPHGMTVGIWCGRRVKGLVCPGSFQASGGGVKMPEVGTADAWQTGRPTGIGSLGVSWDPHKGTQGRGQRQGCRRSPLCGLRGAKDGEGKQPENFLHLFPGKERDEHVSVCVWVGPLPPNPGMR